MTSFDVNPSILGAVKRGTATSEAILKRLQNLGPARGLLNYGNGWHENQQCSNQRWENGS